MRLGIDVGGTNTDAVVIDEQNKVIYAVKKATTLDPIDGIKNAVLAVLENVDGSKIKKVMLGTTHPANAIVQRKSLAKVGVLRLAFPSSTGVLPGADWPVDLREKVIGPIAIVHGGREYDGRKISTVDKDEILKFLRSHKDEFKALAVTGVFSPANFEDELEVAAIIQEELGTDYPISLSHQIGNIGLLERENATILNSSLFDVANSIVEGFIEFLQEKKINASYYLTQNDGTLMTADYAKKFPVFMLGSGPTNSMRGACALSNVKDAIVVDVGGTTTDIGVLVNGFPRQSQIAVEIGGVRTNFRMPDLISIGLGGGTIVQQQANGLKIGPESVGYEVINKALAVGGDTLTLTDIAVLNNKVTDFGDKNLLTSIPNELLQQVLTWIDEQINIFVEKMKTSKGLVPVIAVGGGSHLIPAQIEGIDQVIKPENYAVANAYGAAIAEASGQIERVYLYDEEPREKCIEEAKSLAIENAIKAGADPEHITITTINEIPFAYNKGGACRVFVKASGPLVN